MKPPRGDPKKFDASELGLNMSLNAGVAIFDRDGDPSRAYAELRFQSAVHKTSDGRQRLVDSSEHRENFSLWIELLQFRQRIYGLEGVVDVWRGMRRRSIDLPVEGREADVLWKTFVDASFGDPRKISLIEQVLKYAQDLKERTGLRYQGLYKLIAGRHFRTRPTNVRRWDERLTAAGLTTPEDLTLVIADATNASNRGEGFRIWLSLARDKAQHEIYNIAITEILKFEDDKLAAYWHRSLLGHGHAPSTAMSETAAVRKLVELDKNWSSTMIRSSAGRSTDSKRDTKNVQPGFPQLTRASMNTIVGDVYGIKPKEISDSFCARLFATRAFSLDLVIKGLSFLSVDTLGPLATREMAVRAGSPVEFNQKLNGLEKLGIKIGTSVYAQLVVKASRDRDARLWNAVLETDQHPDVYEDAVMQEALVISFLQQRRLNQAHLSLSALSWATKDAQHRAWNRVLQHYIIDRDYEAIFATVQTIQNQGLPLTLYSLTLLRRYLLPGRRRGKRPNTHDRRPRWALHLVMNACTHTASKRGYVPINLWVEVLKRYGMTRRWRRTEGLVLWLLEHYTVNNPAIMRNANRRVYLGQTRARRQALRLRLLFSPVMLRALFTWGFRTFNNNLNFREDDGKTLSREPWARGLALLRQIQDRKLFEVTADARSSFQQRMWVLFGAGYSTLRTNNLARLYNRISLAHYINHANEIWPGLVDWVDPALLREDDDSDPQLLVRFFGSMYRTKRSTLEYASVGEWTKHLTSPRHNLKHSHYSRPATIGRREWEWRNSPMRIVFSPPAPTTNPEQSPEPRNEQSFEPSSTTTNTLDAKYQPITPQGHQSPSAHSSNWRPPPSPRYIPAPP